MQWKQINCKIEIWRKKHIGLWNGFKTSGLKTKVDQFKGVQISEH